MWAMPFKTANKTPGVIWNGWECHLKAPLLSMKGIQIFDEQINLPENKLENTQLSCFYSTFFAELLNY